MSNEDKQNIFVFDEKYIEDNIRLKKDGLNTIVMLGEQVDLDKQIQLLEADLIKCKKDEENQKQVCEGYNTSTNPLSPAFHYEAIKTRLKEPGGWAETDSKIKGNRSNSRITEPVIREIINLAPSKTLAELQAEFESEYELFKQISDNQEKNVEQIKTIDLGIDSGFDEKVVNLLSKTLKKPELTERESKILDAMLNGFQERVESARNSFSKEDTKMCPFCYQPVSEEYKADLINSIDKVLNKEVDDHKEDLENLIVPTIEFEETKYLKLDSAQEKILE